MGWIKDRIDDARDILGSSVRAATGGPRILRRLARGDDPKTVARDYAADHLKVAKKTTALVSGVEADIRRIAVEAVGDVAGEDAAGLIRDVIRICEPADLATTAAYVAAFENFVRTGDFDFLNPMVGLVAAEIQRTRDEYWHSAVPVSVDVQAVMPEKVRAYATAARCISMKKVRSRLNLPAFAIEHLGRAGAIVLIDLIFFKSVPGGTTQDDKFLWAHELHHVRQYSEWGLLEFVKRFVGEELGFQPKDGEGNAIEVAADRFACKNFPIDHAAPPPYYISRCPEA